MRQHGPTRRLPLRHFLSLFFTAIFPSTTQSLMNFYGDNNHNNNHNNNNNNNNAQQKPPKFVDPILGARCDIRCWNHPSIEKSSCLSRCLEEPWIKPGVCPAQDIVSPNTVTDGASSLERACVNSCKQDNECSGILKCCQHSCGITCQTPLHTDIAFNNCAGGVPPICDNITIDINKENPAEDGIVMIIRWSVSTAAAAVTNDAFLANTTTATTSNSDANNSSRRHRYHYGESSKTIYLLEERHHVGKKFVPETLTDWLIRRRSTRPKVTIKNLYRPGRWYVFRVTAINENGTKGPSQPSKPFFAAVSPKSPGLPGNLKVGATSWGNGRLHLQLIWKMPHSDLPIHKYKVTYSRLKNFTLIQHHHSLPPSTTYFWLKDLEPNTEYFLQVQAFSKFGKRRLAGETASIVFNTAHHRHTNRSTYSTDKKVDEKQRLKYKRKVQNFKVDKLYWLRDQLLATISWTSVRTGKIYYYVRWAHNGCHNNGKSWYIAKTDMTTFEVYDLLPECEYTISIKATWQQTLYMNKMVFNTNNCRKNNSAFIPSSIIIDCPYNSSSSSLIKSVSSPNTSAVTSLPFFQPFVYAPSITTAATISTTLPPYYLSP